MRLEFNKQLEEGLSRLQIPVDHDRIDLLECYYTELKKWNRKVNLIAKAASDLQIVEKHFLDSLTLLPYLQKKSCHLLDIGTGGGFPGLVCKAALANLKVTLVEPRLKRVSFLRHIVRSTHLSDVQIYSSRVEDVTETLRKAAISHITSRAVGEIGIFLKMIAPLAGSGGAGHINEGAEMEGGDEKW